MALGDIGRAPRPVTLTGAQRLRPGKRGYIGTDLSGSHPISFVVPQADGTSDAGERDMGIRALGTTIRRQELRLDAQGKMQCTTCHDPHSDRYYEEGRVPRFWIRPTEEEVCLNCHELR